MADLERDQVEASKPAPAIAAEPSLLAETAPTEEDIADGAMYPSSEVRRIVGRTWRAARKVYERKLEERLARQRAELERAFQAKREDLVREVAHTTKDLLEKEWKRPWQTPT